LRTAVLLGAAGGNPQRGGLAMSPEQQPRSEDYGKEPG
jgi:hypothetical protein